MLAGILIVVFSVAALSHIAPFPFLFEIGRGKSSIWRMPVSPGQRIVYLTFDDGPNPTVTGQLLDLLKEKHAQATFFLIPAHIDETTVPLVRRMFAEGHAVGQHSADRWLMLHSSSGVAAEIKAQENRLEPLAGHKPCPVFRPHAGWRSISMLRGLDQAGYRLVGWSWMTWDWVWFRERTGPRVAAQVVSHAAPGKIIIIHDGHHINPRADRQYALEAVDQIIDQLRADGYEFAAFCEALPPEQPNRAEGGL